MKKSIITTIILMGSVLVLSAFSGCKRDLVALRATIADFGGPKVYMEGSTPRWRNGDTVCVNEHYVVVSSVDGINATMHVPVAGAYKAVYPGSIVQPLVNGNTAQLSIPRLQIYREDAEGRQVVAAPMCAAGNDGMLSFKNMGALLAVTLTLPEDNRHDSVRIDSISVRSVSYNSTDDLPVSAVAMWGSAVADVSAGNPTYGIVAPPTAGVNDSVVLARGAGQGLRMTLSGSAGGISSKTVYIYVPAVSDDVNNLFCIRVFVKASDGLHYTYVMSQTGAYAGNIQRNTKAEVPFVMSNNIEHEVPIAPVGGIAGYFTVNAQGLRVFFAQGNLQYRQGGTHAVACPPYVAPGTWRFAENQWDILGQSNITNWSDSSEWKDYFSFGTSGVTELADPMRYRLEFNYPNTTDGNIYDWGLYNAISNGGNVAGQWRTLSGEEWEYVIGSSGYGRVVNGGRGNGNSYQSLTINGRFGVLIYHDSFTQQSSYTIDSELTDVPEGCVFLPYAGRRRVDDVTKELLVVNVGRYAQYWSSAQRDARHAYKLYAYPEGTVVITTDVKHLGFSVRLVQNVNED